MDRETMKSQIRNAIKKLVKFDGDIFNQNLPKLGKSTEMERLLNRELHETAINHRLAVYLEQGFLETKITEYNFDIEYNRNFSDPQKVKIGKIRIPVRPDILIHKRMRTNESSPHLLVIEAKKHKILEHDINKIIGFMTAPQYLYEFGLTVSYAYYPRKVDAIFYFKENTKINTELIEVSRI
jgi:hypothetical protein